jgi:serine/threonine protein phosphatase 1
MSIIIVGDLAGRYDEFMDLLAKLPEHELLIAVGDLMDRGPNSKEVIQWFIDNKDKSIALYGNHEDMMIEALVNGRSRDWLYNGGHATLNSYKVAHDDGTTTTEVPNEHVEFLQSLPLYWTNDNIFVSHAPITSMMEVPKDPYSKKVYHFIWNRTKPRRAMDKFVVNGHNSEMDTYKDKHDKTIGMCIDDSRNQRLCALHWPSMDVYSVNYKPQKDTK